jgi:hypothetical protein
MSANRQKQAYFLNIIISTTQDITGNIAESHSIKIFPSKAASLLVKLVLAGQQARLGFWGRC